MALPASHDVQPREGSDDTCVYLFQMARVAADISAETSLLPCCKVHGPFAGERCSASTGGVPESPLAPALAATSRAPYLRHAAGILLARAEIG